MSGPTSVPSFRHPESHRLRLVDELTEKAVVHPSLNDKTARRRAALPGRSEGTPEQTLHRQLEIGVVEYYHRVLPTHLEGEPLVHPPRGLADGPSGLRRAGEREQRNLRVLDDCLPHRLADAMDELDHLRWQTRLEEDLDEHRSGVRHVLGRLEDARVPAHERGKHLPRRNRERKIERCDDPGDADRPAKAHRPLVPQLRRHGVAEETAPFRRRVVRSVDPFLHVAARLGERLAHLARHQVRDLVLSPGEEVADAAKHLATFRCRRATPDVEPAFRRAHRAVDVLRGGERKLADDVGDVGGIAILEILTRRRGDPFASDEILVGLH